MAFPTLPFPNVSGPNFAACDLLFYKTDWTNADVANGYIGADGTIGSNPSLLKVFDCRTYRKLFYFLYAAGVTGTSTPTIYARILSYDALTPHPGTSVTVGSSLSEGITSTGGTCLIAGETGLNGYASTGVANINEGPVVVGFPALFAQFQVVTTGSVSSFTALRTFIYGVR